MRRYHRLYVVIDPVSISEKSPIFCVTQGDYAVKKLCLRRKAKRKKLHTTVTVIFLHSFFVLRFLRRKKQEAN